MNWEGMNRNNVLLWVIVAALLVLAVWLGMKIGNPGESSSKYWAVTMVNGEVYFGRLKWWPKPHLESAWVMQRGTDAEGKPQVQFLPYSRAFWNPMNEVYLNPMQILTWSRLTPDTDLVRAIENPDSLQPQNPPNNVPGLSGQDGFRGPAEPPPASGQ